MRKATKKAAARRGKFNHPKSGAAYGMGKRGTKKAARRAAVKTAKVAGQFRVPRSAQTLADAIVERTKRSPDYWKQVQTAMDLRQRNYAVTGMPAPDMTAH